MIMVENQKKFNLYVFISTFARALIETFIPLLLFKFGYSLKDVVFYFLIYNFIELVISYPLVYLATKKGNKLLAIFGFIGFVLTQIMLNKMYIGLSYLIIIATLYAIYRTGYWLSRRYFNLKVIQKKNISSTYSIVTIVNQVALIFAGYIGSLILDFIGTNVLTIIAILLYVISIIPLFMFKFEHDEANTDVKIELFKTLKEVSFNNIYIFGSYEILNVLKFFFTLYLFIYVKNTYQTVGLFNLITNLSVMIFAFYYGKKTDGKKNYLKLSIILTCLVYVLKANVVSVLLVIISLLEGIAIKMYEISMNKEMYSLSKKFEYNNYNLMYEIVCKVFRAVVLVICYFFINDLKVMIYVSVVGILIGLFINIKKIKKKDFEFE
jgi:MFS family permease